MTSNLEHAGDIFEVTFLSPTIPVYTIQGATAGPTAIIQAGIHGDEIAGIYALQELLETGIRPHRGRLIIIPIMNPAAYRARTRTRPNGPDLNRCFPGDPTSPVFEIQLARKFMDLMETEKPGLVATLHESWKRYDPEVTPSFGQTLVYGVKPMPPLLERVIAGMNVTKECAEETWDSLYFPVETSSTEVIVDAIGCVGTCVETWMGFDERRRIDMQKEVVIRLLHAFNMLDDLSMEPWKIT